MKACVVLFECPQMRLSLLPLAYTRAVPDFRVGILTLAQKWAQRIGTKPTVYCAEPYLRPLYPVSQAEDMLFVHAHLCPDDDLFGAVSKLSSGESLWYEDRLLATRLSLFPVVEKGQSIAEALSITKSKSYSLHTKPKLLDKLYKALDWNAEEISNDLALLDVAPLRASSSAQLRIHGTQPVYVSTSAHFYELSCNTEQGPIYIGEDVEIEAGVHIQGPVCVGKGTQLRTGARLRAATSLGPNCKVAGELSHSILFSYSNKAHDGFLGNSILGSWCNLGAGTSCSNLKNNYAEVSLWDTKKKDFLSTARQFCGMFMGDHAKSAINQSFNSGSWVGPFSNVFGAGFAPRYIPPFSWGGAEGLEVYRFEEAMQAAERMMQRREKILSPAQRQLFSQIFKESQTRS